MSKSKLAEEGPSYRAARADSQFQHPPTRPLRRLVVNLGIAYSTIQNTQRKQFHSSRQKITKLHQLQSNIMLNALAPFNFV